MQFEHDAIKSIANHRLHKISFETVRRIYDRPVLERAGGHGSQGETRISTLGEVAGRVIFVAFAARNGRRRMVAARRATEDERKAYYDHTRPRDQGSPPRPT